jgi:cell fate (sporulation/competence/biofilm development) regulator YlbF (YheA/YmcA/DUF963 family)
MEIVTRDEVMEAARAFGEALRATEECRAVEGALEALSVDEEANRTLAEGGGVLFGDAGANAPQAMRKYAEAQKSLQLLLGRLNAEMSGILGLDFAAHARQRKGGCH